MNVSTKISKAQGLALCLLSSIVFCGCQTTGTNGPQFPSKDNFFDFSTTKNCAVSIDYGFKDYIVVFELFENYPLVTTDNGTIVKTNEEPLYRGATDKNGVFNGDISMPSFIKEVYLYSDFIGAVSPVKLTIENSRVSFSQKQRISGRSSIAQRATTTSGYNFPDSFFTLSDWDVAGKPGNIKVFDGIIDAELLYSIRKIYVEPSGGASINDLYPTYVSDNVNIEVDIKKETEVSLVFLHTTASMQNSVGYFTYKTGEKPTDISQIQHIIAFPRISTSNCNSTAEGSMYTGDKVELKYWDGQQFNDKFPAGVSIGWYLIQNGFESRNGSVTVNGRNVFYSIRDLNPDNTHRTIALKNPLGKEIVAIGFEDANAFKNNSTNPKNGNFGDAVFYLEFDKDAIEVDGVPDLPEVDIDKAKLYTTYFGMLSFEDLWPAQGDYDMNDIIVEYKREVYKNIMTGKVYKLIDVFTPKHTGGSQKNGFGYQLTGINGTDITNIKIESDAGVSSQFMQGQSLELNQNYPTIVLYDNNMDVIGKTFTVTIDITPELYTERSMTPFLDHRQSTNAPYLFNLNPFIIVGTDKGRGKEAHLTNFPPTALADKSYFGTMFDVSRPHERLYYVNNKDLPTALHIANVKTGNVKGKDFLITKEGISIIQSYPKFEGWAKSKGAQNSIWWKDPSSEYIENK